MTIAIFGNTFHRTTTTAVQHILEVLGGRGVHVLLSSELRQEMNLREQYEPYSYETEQNIDFALSVGGDGTFLTTASYIRDKNIPILGINSGHLGFLADVQMQDIDAVLEQLLTNNYTIEQRTLLSVSANGALLANTFALNEVAVMKQELSSMIEITASVATSEGTFPLHSYKADGLLLSTTTGSTAYNLSIGGPIMVPQVKAFILSPIATHSLNVRPLVIPEDWQIDLSVRSRSHTFLISIDGRSQILRDNVSIHIERAPYTVKMVQIGSRTFIQTLQEKLHWGA